MRMCLVAYFCVVSSLVSNAFLDEIDHFVCAIISPLCIGLIVCARK